MTDRDFKLLVREYFQAKGRIHYTYGAQALQKVIDKKDTLEKRILSELETFSDQEQKELPFIGE